MNVQGKYKTKQRDLILGYLENNKDTHLTADGIAEYMRNQEKPVSRSTVYRYLDVLVKEGLVRKYVIEEGKCCCYQYVSKENTCKSHYHFKCSKCMKLLHVDCDILDKIYEHVKSEHGFVVDNSKTVFYGLCKACREELENNQIETDISATKENNIISEVSDDKEEQEITNINQHNIKHIGCNCGLRKGGKNE